MWILAACAIVYVAFVVIFALGVTSVEDRRTGEWVTQPSLLMRLNIGARWPLILAAAFRSGYRKGSKGPVDW